MGRRAREEASGLGRRMQWVEGAGWMQRLVAAGP